MCFFCLCLNNTPGFSSTSSGGGATSVTSHHHVNYGESQVPMEWLRASRASTGRSFLSSLDVPWDLPNENHCTFSGDDVGQKTY